MKPVARATLQAALGSALAKTVPEHIYLQLDAHALEEALTEAGAGAVDSVRAEPTGDRAIALMERLYAGLADRGVADGGDAVTRALSTIDAFQTALDEAARDTHEAVELEAVYDDGLSTDQEIRVRALDVAARVLAGRDAYNLGDVAVLDAATATVQIAAHFEAYVAGGGIPGRVSAERSDPSKSS